MRIAAALFAIAALPSFALDLKGLEPDMPLAEAARIIDNPEFIGKCSPSPNHPSRLSCYYASRYAGKTMPRVAMFDTLAARPVETWMVVHNGDKLDSILVYMKSMNYDHVIAALTEKWGMPTKVEQSEIQNRMGAKFDQSLVEWAQGEHLLRVRKRASKVDEMSLLLTSKRAAQEAELESKDQAKKAGKDL